MMDRCVGRHRQELPYAQACTHTHLCPLISGQGCYETRQIGGLHGSLSHSTYTAITVLSYRLTMHNTTALNPIIPYILRVNNILRVPTIKPIIPYILRVNTILRVPTINPIIPYILRVNNMLRVPTINPIIPYILRVNSIHRVPTKTL